MGSAARTGSGDNFRQTVIINIAGRHAYSAAKIFIISEKLHPDIGVIVKNSYMRTAARTRGGNDFQALTSRAAVNISQGDSYSSPKIFIVCEKLPLHCPVRVKNSYLRTAGFARASDNLAFPVPIHIAANSIDPSAEIFVISEKLPFNIAVLIKNSHMRTAAKTGAGNNFVRAVAVKIASRHINASPKVFCVSEKLTFQFSAFVKNSHMRTASRTGSGDNFIFPVAVHISGGNANAA